MSGHTRFLGVRAAWMGDDAKRFTVQRWAPVVVDDVIVDYVITDRVSEHATVDEAMEAIRLHPVYDVYESLRAAMPFLRNLHPVDVERIHVSKKSGRCVVKRRNHTR